MQWHIHVPSEHVVNIERMHTLVAEFPGYDGYPDNNRPVQPLGARTVQRRDS